MTPKWVGRLIELNEARRTADAARWDVLRVAYAAEMAVAQNITVNSAAANWGWRPACPCCGRPYDCGSSGYGSALGGALARYRFGLGGLGL